MAEGFCWIVRAAVSQRICCFTAWVAMPYFVLFCCCCCVCMMSVTRYLFAVDIVLIGCSIFSSTALQNGDVAAVFIPVHVSCALLLNFQLKIYFKFRPQFLTQLLVWFYVWLNFCRFLVNISFSFVPRFILPLAVSLGQKDTCWECCVFNV